MVFQELITDTGTLQPGFSQVFCIVAGAVVHHDDFNPVKGILGFLQVR